MPHRARRWIVPGWSILLATVVLGPLIGSGWVLLLDWVVGPRSVFSDRILSGNSLPAGPVFFGTAALLETVIGGAVGWVLPMVLLVVGGIGAANLVRQDGSGVSTLAACTASTAYIWNPFVHERLYSGQLAVLAGYAALPYLLALSLRAVIQPSSTGGFRGKLRHFAPGAVWALAAAASIHYAILGGIVVAVVGAVGWASGHGARRGALRWTVSVTAFAVLLTAAWLLPVIDEAPPTGNQQTIAAFATRADPNLGLAGGVALQTGFWRPSPGEPNSTLGWWWPFVGGFLGGAALIGLFALAQSNQKPNQKRCALVAGTLGLIGWLFGQGGNGPIGQIFRVLTDVPTFRVMREAGKFVALLSLAWAVGLAGCADLVVRSFRAFDKSVVQRTLRVLSWFVLVLPIGLSPGLAWGVGGRLRTAHYPPAWSAIQRELNRHPSGDLIVLPFVGYVDPGFTDNRVVRSPAKAFFGSRVVLSDDPQVAGLPPSPSTRTISAALNSDTPGRLLAELGIGWVVAASNDAPTPDFKLVMSKDNWALLRVKAFRPEPGTKA